MNPTPPPDFVRAYHLVQLAHAKTNIESRRLKVATFADANDPFELLALNLRGRGKRDVRKALKAFKEAQASEIGMLCFSRTWSNPVLWSHYAEGHKGVCLGFDLREDSIEEVDYAPEPLTARLSDEQDPPFIPDDLQDRLFLTKFHHWAYEDEVRRFVTLSEAQFDQRLRLYFWPFDDDMRLREVVLGPLCPTAELELIRTLVRKANAEAVVSRARLAFGAFKVRPDGRYPPA